MSNVITRSKNPLKIVRTKITSKNPITEDVLKVMIDIIKDDLITRRFSEEESIEKEDKDIYKIDKRIDAYKKKNPKLTLEYITAKEGEYYLKKRQRHHNKIEGLINGKNITLADINNKNGKYYLDEKAQAYYYNLWIKIFRNPNTPKNETTREGNQFIDGKITFLGKSTSPAPIATVSSGSLIPLPKKSKSYIEGGSLLGTTPRPLNLLHGIHYADPDWSYFTKARAELNIYSMQLPYQFNRIIMLQTFIELMYVQEVKILLNLHGCDTHTNHGSAYNTGKGCNRDDMKSEGELWELTKNITQETQRDDDIRYISAGIKDFDPGHISTWDTIFNSVGDTKLEQNRIVVHCLAGMGRTGSVVLALLMRDFIPVQELRQKIHIAHLGYINIRTLIDEIKKIFDTNANSTKIFNELFGITVPNYLKLLRPRLNCIFYCLAKYHKITSFAMYSKVYNPSNDVDIEFSSPVVTNLLDWNSHSTNDISATENARFFTL